MGARLGRAAHSGVPALEQSLDRPPRSLAILDIDLLYTWRARPRLPSTDRSPSRNVSWSGVRKSNPPKRPFSPKKKKLERFTDCWSMTKPRRRGLPVKNQIAPRGSLWVGLVALEYGMCRFPRDGGAGVEFCGAPVFPGSSWCKEHHRLCHSREKSRVSFVLPRLSAS